MTTEEMFKKELSELLRKYDCALSAEDHWQGYAECGEDVRMTVEFNDYRLSDVDLGRYFDGGEKP